MDLFTITSGTISMVLLVLLLALKGYAFADAIFRPLESFPAADKQTKPFWLVILGLSLVVQLVFLQPINLFNIVGTVVSAVYVVGVRPALKEVGGSRGGGRSSEGPYGPW